MEKVAIFFNTIGNTLDIWFDDPKKEFLCEETGEEAILKKDKDGNVTGIEILNFMPKPEERMEVVKKFVPIKIVAQRSQPLPYFGLLLQAEGLCPQSLVESIF